ncbi:MAG: sigma factor-like helix-turn-helix DNA-binding protein [Isosphaeraceae bacterium]
MARRVAARARVESARRRRLLERFAATRPAEAETTNESPASTIAERLDHAVLLAEVARLPERFRAPVVLHYFEGLSTEATAQRLGCARGTVLSRLSRARSRLKQRLEDRGAAPGLIVAIGDAVPRWLPVELVPSALAQATVRSAGALGLAGISVESAVPTAVARLSRRVARTLSLARAAALASILVVAAGVSIGLAASLQTASTPQRGEMMKKSGADRGKAPSSTIQNDSNPEETVAVRGRVLDPDGKPVGGAQVLLSVPQVGLTGEPQRLGTTSPDGQFDIRIPKSAIERPLDRPEGPNVLSAIVAFSPGLGPDWELIDAKRVNEPMTLRLRPDDVPVEGRIITLEGRPAEGVSARVAAVAEFPSELLERLRKNAGAQSPSLWTEMRNVCSPGDRGLIPPATTGADGRFRLTGIGRDRVVFLIIEGPAIEQTIAFAVTSGDRNFQPVPMPSDGSMRLTLQPARFETSVAPGSNIRGTIRDRDTGRPIAGARITTWSEGSRPLTSDGRGQFRLTSQPRGRENYLTITVEDRPYIKLVKSITNVDGKAPVDVTLKRGVWIEGKVVNKATGKAVKAVVTYYPYRDNPHIKECPDASFLNNHLGDEVEFPTDAQGRFRAVGLPGGGILAVQVKEPGYLTAKPLDDRTAGNVLHAANFEYYITPYHALVMLDVPNDKATSIPEIALAAGREQHIQIVGPDGKPVTGARILCLQVGLLRESLTGEIIADAEWPFTNSHPGKAESIIISHAGRSLGAVIELKGDEPDPVRVVLQPCGTVTGRLVDEEGKPRPGMRLRLGQRFRSAGQWTGTERMDGLTTDRAGRFRIATLVPGLHYDLEVLKKPFVPNYSDQAEGYLSKNEWTVKPGETIDWGDVQVRTHP